MENALAEPAQKKLRAEENASVKLEEKEETLPEIEMKGALHEAEEADGKNGEDLRDEKLQQEKGGGVEDVSSGVGKEEKEDGGRKRHREETLEKKGEEGRRRKEEGTEERKDAGEGEGEILHDGITIAEDEKGRVVSEKRYYKKRKVALYVAYCGAGFQGMQKNPGARTIEGELEKALFRAGAILEEDFGDQRKIDWMRAARTDKGVSAIGQVVSARLVLDPPGFVARVNSHLPKAIRILGVARVIASFSARGLCDRRRYEYLIPTFALDPFAHRDRAFLEAHNLLTGERAKESGLAEHLLPKLAGGGEENLAVEGDPVKGQEGESGEARETARAEVGPDGQVADGEQKKADGGEGKVEIGSADGGGKGSNEGVERAPCGAGAEAAKKFEFGKAELKRLNGLLQKFCGTHKFHNYTVHTKADDPAATRYIVSFKAEEEVMETEGISFIRCIVVGQSFMLHQIRKMIAIVIAIMRGHAPEKLLTDAFRLDKRYKLPMAPELGLFLDECLFASYNKKWHTTHDEVTLDHVRGQVDEFKRSVVYPHIARTEKTEHTMAKWLSTLNDRDFPDFALARAIASGKLEDD